MYKQVKDGSEKQNREKDKKKEETLLWFKGRVAVQREMWKTVVGEWNTWMHDFASDDQIHSMLMGMRGWGVTKGEGVRKPSVVP